MTCAAEMTPKTYKMIFPFILPAVLAVLLAVLPSCGYTYPVLLLTRIFMYVILALSWTMFSGPTGKISLATSAFFGAGVYTAAILSLKLPLWAVVGAGGLSGLCLGLVVGALTLRLRGIYFVMFTFGLVELLLNFILWWEVSISGTTGRIVAGVLPQQLAFVSAANDAGRTVMVHCTSGKDRTGMFMGYYLMQTEALSVAAAIDKVKRVRPIALTAQDWEEFTREVLLALSR